ncbi:MAG: DUF4034 domain-containing protein, partial [Calditrichaceae bacterium]
LRNMLEMQNYEELNRVLDSYQKLFLRDQTDEFKVYDAFNSFQVVIPSYEELLIDWVNEYPDAYQPYLALAKFYYIKGWQSRGHKYVSETSHEQFEGMHFYFDLAEKNALQAISINPDLMAAYDLLIGIYNTGGPHEKEYQTIIKAIELFPYSYLIWSAASWATEPRWGGSYYEMENLAKEAEKFISVNPRLVLLYGFIYYDQGRYASSDNRNEQAIELFNKARSFGDCRKFNYELAKIYYYDLKQYDMALGHLAKCIQLRPTINEAYLIRSEIYLLEEKYGQAIENLKLAERIDPMDTSLDQTKEWACKYLVFQGNKLFRINKQAAIDKYDLAVQFDSEYYEPYHWRAVIFYQQKDFESALVNAKRAVELNPRHFESYRILDYTLAQYRDWNTIIHYWNSYMALEPNNPDAYFERSGTHYHNGHMQSALADLKKACELGHKGACQKYKQLAGSY